MGIKESVPRNMETLDRDNWSQMVGPDRDHHHIGNSIKFSNKMTGEEVDQFDIYFIDSQEYQTFLESCSFRNAHPELVGIKYLNEEHHKELCSFTYHVKIYIQRIPLRLSNITDVPFPENLYILREALAGFKILYDKVGYFRVCEEMICMSEDGTVKVWLNPDLSKNYINYFQDYNSSLETENQIIWDILEFVDAVTDKETEEFVFMDFIKKDLHQTNLNFNKALNFLDLFIEKWRVDVPRYFPSIVRKIREEKGIYDSEVDNESSFKFFQERSHLRGRFKESEVVRIKTVRGDSVHSFIGSESNRTYADKLNTFDSQISNHLAFGKSINDQAKRKNQNRASRASNPLPFEEVKQIDTNRSKNEKGSQKGKQEEKPEEFEPMSPESYIKKLKNESIKQFPQDEEEESKSIIKGNSKMRQLDSERSFSKHGEIMRDTNGLFENRSSRCSSIKGPAVKFSISGHYIKEVPLSEYSHSRAQSRIDNSSRTPSLHQSYCEKQIKQPQFEIKPMHFSVDPEQSMQFIKQSQIIKNSSILNEEQVEQEMDEVKTEKNYEIVVNSPTRKRKKETMTELKGEDMNKLSIFDFQFELDPIIAADLAKYQQEKKRQKTVE